jgi:hypothetical protein
MILTTDEKKLLLSILNDYANNFYDLIDKIRDDKDFDKDDKECLLSAFDYYSYDFEEIRKLKLKIFS